MPLTESQIRAAKPREKPYKLTDGQGLVLLVSPTGARLWRLRYTFAGREGMISVGTYPATSLKEARERRDVARKQIEAGLNPSSIRAEARQQREVTFEAIAKEWLARQTFTEKTRTKAEWMIKESPWVAMMLSSNYALYRTGHDKVASPWPLCRVERRVP
ncbi:MAG: DUF4102 domain-containing protein [Gammaproteobacteria bacterium]|nr:DUF4102 domain-containing protein [Gammaproteobacteria bacterium]